MTSSNLDLANCKTSDLISHLGRDYCTEAEYYGSKRLAIAVDCISELLKEREAITSNEYVGGSDLQVKEIEKFIL